MGIDECDTCKQGFYSSDAGSSTCFTCNPGKYTNKEQTACISCPAGKISGLASSEVRLLHQFPTHFSFSPYATSDPNPIRRHSQCTVCDTDKFSEKEGSVECQFCNTEEVLKGSITAGEGTSSVSGCICQMENYLNNETSTCDRGA